MVIVIIVQLFYICQGFMEILRWILNILRFIIFTAGKVDAIAKPVID